MWAHEKWRSTWRASPIACSYGTVIFWLRHTREQNSGQTIHKHGKNGEAQQIKWVNINWQNNSDFHKKHITYNISKYEQKLELNTSRKKNKARRLCVCNKRSHEPSNLRGSFFLQVFNRFLFIFTDLFSRTW